MPIRSILAVPLAAFALSGALAAAKPGAEPSPPSGDPVAALAWMAGEWSGVDDRGVTNEERWMEPAGGMMLGMHRDVAGGRATSFEFLRIESTPGGVVYFASPRGKPATPFKMVESGGRRVVFENPQHDLPTRILYWLGPTGELHARIEGKTGGKPMAEEWTWTRRPNK